MQSERTPDGDAVGIGTPPASQGAGLTAGDGQATTQPATTVIGRPTASQAVRVDEAHDGLPPRIGSLPAGKAPRQERRQRFTEDQRDPNVWDGHAEECRRRMMARMDERRRREAAEIEAAKATGKATARQMAVGT